MSQAGNVIEQLQKNPGIAKFEDIVDTHAEQLDRMNEISDFFSEYSES